MNKELENLFEGQVNSYKSYNNKFNELLTKISEVSSEILLNPIATNRDLYKSIIYLIKLDKKLNRLTQISNYSYTLLNEIKENMRSYEYHIIEIDKRIDNLKKKVNTNDNAISCEQ